MGTEYLVLNTCLQWLLQYYPTFFFRWNCKDKVAITHTEANHWLLRLKSLYLSDNLKVREAVQVYTALLQHYYALRSHSDSLDLCIKVELLKFVDFKVVPHDNFSFGPFRVCTSSNKSHDILSVQHFNDANASMQLSAQLELQWIALIYPEPRLRPHRDATLILIKAQEDDLIWIDLLLWSLLAGRALIYVGLVAAAERYHIEIARTCIIRDICNRAWMLVGLGLSCEST